MKIEVLYFGLIEEALGIRKETITMASETSLLQVKAHLLSKYPALKQIAFQTALNKKIVPNEALIHQDAEIALLPPFAGG